MSRTRRLTTAAAALLVGAGGLLATSVPAAAATCSDVEVVFARGTGETPGLGVVGTPFVRTLTAQLAGRSVSSYAVDYAANTSQTSAGPGATDASTHVRQVAAQCPGTAFVLGGYSQGATVTDIALGIRTGTTTGTPVPAELSGRVAAVVVFGNPLGLSGGRTVATASSTYGPRSKDYCNSSDTVCGSQPKTGTGGHLDYGRNGSVDAGAVLAAGLVRSAQPTTPSPTPTPTTCVTDSTRAHVAADRAVSLYGRAYARGTRDSLGPTSSYTTVSLRQVSGGWQLVGAC